MQVNLRKHKRQKQNTQAARLGDRQSLLLCKPDKMLGEKYCGGDGRNFEDNYLDFENVDDYDNVDIMIS